MATSVVGVLLKKKMVLDQVVHDVWLRETENYNFGSELGTKYPSYQ